MPLFGRTDPKPDWASNLSSADFRSLKSDVEDVLRDRGASFSWDEPSGIRIDLPNDQVAIAALHRLADRYRDEDPRCELA